MNDSDVPKLSESQRAAIADVVHALVSREYGQLAADGRAGRLSAEELETAVRQYPGALVSLPEEAWALVEVYPLDDGTGVVLEVPMWTAEEGRSDLTLQLTASERDGVVAVGIDGLHVL
jgi:hypothetical protein